MVTELVQLDKPLAYVLGQFPRALHLIQIPFTDAQLFAQELNLSIPCPSNSSSDLQP
jgi:hypothetical protein